MFTKYFENQDIELIKVSKNQILQRPGNIASKAFYVKSGLLRSFKIDDNGKIHILTFAPENWIISDIASQIMSLPSELFIDALEDSEIYQISQISSETFNSNNENNNQLIQKLFRRIAVLQNRVVLLMSATAKQRYQHFLETYPQLVNRIPLKMVASYLGITPEALSNIRKRIKNQAD